MLERDGQRAEFQITEDRMNNSAMSRNRGALRGRRFEREVSLVFTVLGSVRGTEDRFLLSRIPWSRVGD